MTQDEMNALMTERFELEAAGEIDWQARAERAEVERDALRAQLAAQEWRRKNGGRSEICRNQVILK